jgi:hypothetical protein
MNLHLYGHLNRRHQQPLLVQKMIEDDHTGMWRLIMCDCDFFYNNDDDDYDDDSSDGGDDVKYGDDFVLMLLSPQPRIREIFGAQLKEQDSQLERKVGEWLENTAPTLLEVTSSAPNLIRYEDGLRDSCKTKDEVDKP